MREIVLHRYWQPPPAWKPRAKPTLSVPLTAEEAASRGLSEADPATRQVRQVDGRAPGMAHLGAAPKHGHRID